MEKFRQIALPIQKPAKSRIEKSLNWIKMETELERHHSIISDHELNVDIDGDVVVFRERKEFSNVVKNSNEIESTSVHTRFIGDEYLTVTQTMKDGKTDETRETNLGDSEEAVDNFKNKWELCMFHFHVVLFRTLFIWFCCLNGLL